MVDDFDLSILKVLQEDGRLSNQALAERVNLSTSPCWRRVKRLEENGVIQGYAAILDADKLGLHALAYIHIKIMDHAPATLEKFSQFVSANPQVLECSSITGSYDYLLKVIAEDAKALERFLMDKLLSLGIVRETNTDIVLRQMRCTTALPLAPARN
jgi:Lrp/AsnC family transcriptional regulator, leucine-responsive regulatory protein